MIDYIKQVIAPLSRRVQLMVSRCKLSLINDTTATQSSQAEFFAGEIVDNAEIWQQFGLTSVAPSGSEGIALFVGGERKNPLIISTENKEHRKKFNQLKEGEVCLYSGSGDSFSLKDGNKVELKTKSLEVTSDGMKFDSKNSIELKTDKMNFDSNNSIEIKTNELKISANKLTLDASQITIGKQTELISVLMELCDELVSAQTKTSIGDMNLLNAEKFALLKLKLKSFQGSGEIINE